MVYVIDDGRRQSDGLPRPGVRIPVGTELHVLRKGQ